MRCTSLLVVALPLAAAAVLGCNREIVDEPAVASAATGIPKGATAAEGVHVQPLAAVKASPADADPLEDPPPHGLPKKLPPDPFGPETIPEPEATGDPVAPPPHHLPKKKGTAL